MDADQAAKIINATEDGWTVVAVAVPTRGLRVTHNANELLFRVEQLRASENWRWVPVSSHKGDEPWESFGPALDDMITKQARLKEKIKLAQHERDMAADAAQNAIDKTVH